MDKRDLHDTVSQRNVRAGRERRRKDRPLSETMFEGGSEILGGLVGRYCRDCGDYRLHSVLVFGIFPAFGIFTVALWGGVCVCRCLFEVEVAHDGTF